MKRNSRAPRVLVNRNAVLELLRLQGMSQRELARRCGISEGYLSQLMSGIRCPSPQVQRRLQEALGVADSAELFIVVEEDG